MKPETKAVVQMMNRYPEDVRQHVRDSVARLLEFYRATGVTEETSATRRRRSRGNVIEVVFGQQPQE